MVPQSAIRQVLKDYGSHLCMSILYGDTPHLRHPLGVHRWRVFKSAPWKAMSERMYPWALRGGRLAVGG